MRLRIVTTLLLLGVLPVLLKAESTANPVVVVGSKNDTEGKVLGEIMAQLLEDRGFRVERKFEFQGTVIAFEALRTGGIHVYPEYSGTVEQVILKLHGRVSRAMLREHLKRRFDMDLLEFFGFSNPYAIAVSRSLAEERGLKRISDLARFPDLRFGFSHEFLNRQDGWPGLAQTYGLTVQPAGYEHSLAYQAVHEGKLDVTDAYATDGEIKKFDLVLLEDDRKYFPAYFAAPLARGDLDDRVKWMLEELAGKATEEEMRTLNLALLEGKSLASVARHFLSAKGLLTGERLVEAPALAERTMDWGLLLSRAATHLKLTLLALLAAMAVAIPLGIVVYRLRALARPVLYVTGTLQTIPSIALLTFMIPFFGTGAKPAVVALFLYALLPIVRNTATALFSIDPVLKKVSVGMGLTLWQRLRYVEIPLAMPTLLAGIKTAAVINVGTATLAAFIGAGGLGAPIATGLALNDSALILEGAIPAALLAILTEWVFEWLERLMIPKHLLQKPAG